VAGVRLDVVKTRRTLSEPIWHDTWQLGPGSHRLVWEPDPALPPRTYVLRLTVTDRAGRRRVYGPARPYLPWLEQAPVVRILGVDAAFAARSYAPGQRADLVIRTDAASLGVQILASGPEHVPTWRNDEMNGVPVTEPVTIDWSRHANGPGRIKVGIGDWPTGLYYARLEGDDGRVGFAPFVVRPAALGRSGVAVVLPTNTWQAYNFYDVDGDGWGDTWYAGGSPPVVLTRPFTNRGVPPRFRSYDLGFLHWIYQNRRDVDILVEDDLERVGTGDELRAAYRLVIFSGHTEYVTEHVYDLIDRYRDLGGCLWFLSSNNFFRRVERRGDVIRRDRLWRELDRPEAALLGVQYLANDDGARQASYVVAPDAPTWAFEGSGVGPGEPFGTYGIEIDARTAASPPGTQVLAAIPDVFGPGRTAEMTYYETPAGAKVFAAGSMNFGGSAERWAVRTLLNNLWDHMLGSA
jgi:hypothetical protein